MKFAKIGKNLINLDEISNIHEIEYSDVTRCTVGMKNGDKIPLGIPLADVLEILRFPSYEGVFRIHD